MYHFIHFFLYIIIIKITIFLCFFYNKFGTFERKKNCIQYCYRYSHLFRNVTVTFSLSYRSRTVVLP